MTDPDVAQQIDAILEDIGGWHAPVLAQLRAIVRKADPAATEDVKLSPGT
jgi:hypothetical protein